MPRPRVTRDMTTTEVARQLRLKTQQLIRWIDHGALPPPSSIDENGVRYFDQKWLAKAQVILKNKRSNIN